MLCFPYLTISGLIPFLSVCKALACCISYSLSHITGHACILMLEGCPFSSILPLAQPFPPSFLPIPLMWLFVAPNIYSIQSRSICLHCMIINTWKQTDHYPSLLSVLASCGQALPTSLCPQPPCPLSLPNSGCLCLFTCLFIHFHFSTFFLSFCEGRKGNQ